MDNAEADYTLVGIEFNSPNFSKVESVIWNVTWVYKIDKTEHNLAEMF